MIQDTNLIIQSYIQYFILPMWLVLGLLDYYCHKKGEIENSSGTKESVIHLLMILIMAIPITLGLVCYINALVLIIMILSFLIHEALLLWDVRYAYSHREITPMEQQIHSYLQVIPFMILSMVICLNWNDFLHIFDFSQTSNYVLKFKNSSLPIEYLLALSIGATAFVVIPYVEELIRSIKSNKK